MKAKWIGHILLRNWRK